MLVDADRYDTSFVDAGPPDGDPPAASSCPMLAPCRCDLTKPFDPPEPVPNINDPIKHELSGRLTGDFKTMYLHRGDLGGPDHLYVARRERLEDPFGVPELLAQFDGMNLRYAIPSRDDLRLYFSASVELGDGGVVNHLFWATRPSTDVPFGPRSRIPGFDHLYAAGTPWIDGTETVLTYWTGVDLDARQLYEARGSDGGFFEHRLLEVPGHRFADFAIKSADELTMYFASQVVPAAPHDVFVVRRPSIDAPFGQPTRLPELSSAGFDWPTWISPDGCTIMIGSSRAGSADIYWARRPE